MSLEKSAGAVVFRKRVGKVYSHTKSFSAGVNYLLLHYKAGHWDFPKGIIEKKETLRETAKREIQEETGIKKVKFLEGFKEHIKYFYKFQGKSVFKIVTLLLVQTNQKEVKISFEHIGFEWLSYKEALERLTFKNAKEILKKADRFIKKHKI